MALVLAPRSAIDLEEEHYRALEVFNEPGGGDGKEQSELLETRSQIVNLQNAQNCPAIPFYTLLFGLEVSKIAFFKRFLRSDRGLKILVSAVQFCEAPF